MIPRRSSRLASSSIETRLNEVKATIDESMIFTNAVFDFSKVLEQQYLEMKEENKDLKSENAHLKFQMSNLQNANKELLEEVHNVHVDLQNCAQIGEEFEQKNIDLNKKVKVLEERLRLAGIARENHP